MRITIYYMLSLLGILAVVAQDAFPVSFTASPSSNVAPGTTLKLTCSFELVKDNFQYVKFAKDGGKEFFEFTQEGANPPSWLQYGQKLSDDPTVNSVVWVTFPASFCNATSLEKNYGCAVSNNIYEFAQDFKTVTLAGPSRELSVNGGHICESGSLILESDVINKTQNISVSISNKRKQVIDLTLKIDGQPVGLASPKNQERVCAYGAETHTFYKFTASGVYNLEYNYTSSGHPFTESCKVTIQEKIVTMTTPITSTQPKIEVEHVSGVNDEEADTTTMPIASDEGGLGGGAIAGIIIGVVGGLCLIGGAIWFFAFRSKDKKHKPVHQSDMPPLDPGPPRGRGGNFKEFFKG